MNIAGTGCIIYNITVQDIEYIIYRKNSGE